MVLSGYMPPVGVAMQNHIHLGVWGGTGLLGYGEPPYRYGHILKRTPIFESAAQVVRSWNGTPMAHVLKSDSTTPLIFRHFQYTLRTDYAGLDLLRALWKREVMFVETIHCADNLSHTNYIWHYFLDQVAHDEQLEPMGNLLVVTISLVDMETVEPLL